MTVELRMYSPTEPKEDESQEKKANYRQAAATYAEVYKLQQQLQFPKPEGRPVLPLPKVVETDERVKKKN